MFHWDVTMNLKEVLALVHESQRAMNAGNYHQAENILKRTFKQGLIDKDPKLLALFVEGIRECRRLHALEVLRIFQMIDPIQALRRDQS